MIRISLPGRRGLARLAVAATLGAATLSATPASAQGQNSGQALRVVLINDLTAIDPVLSQAAFVRNHGFFVYDQLFAFDSEGKAKPQMVDSYTASPDGMRYSFTLRDGLAFHDGQPVRAADAVASIKRWGQRDIVGRALTAATASMDVVDDKTFTITLSRPFALVVEALARPTGSALFVMPERVAKTPANVAITDPTGSGPFTFSTSDWRAGDRAIYRRNPAYRPRNEPADGLAGGKVVQVETVEWLAMPDPATAAAALQNGEIDFIEQPSPDVVSTLERNRQVRTMAYNPVGFQVWLRLNHTQPPFNDPRARQALLHIINQQDVLDGMGVRPSEQIANCPAFFFCGTPLESRAGATGLGKPDLDRARALLKEAGYNGGKVVFLNATDSPLNNASTLVMADAMQRAGLNMDVPSMDWGTLTQRRNRREAPEAGGWNLFVTVANVLDGQNPLTNQYLASTGDAAPAGWPKDEELEALRRAWWEESDPAKRQTILDQVQARAFQVLPYIPAAQFRTLAAYRSNVEGLRPTTVPVFWGVTKKQ
ncbi:ABC transporter substrate-binding protein [Pseudoroseomonas wenyumeiae]|uniref:ABC transporter substrate-binding protein n=1 Tax=Teichococcus wenyumeiae TaxID=2478470 RepID=A0A3A9JGC7_9PROT|nr:ABC transporter substrate-binding protein [Pseudoroseomonas wenyumeiae]RKK03763.1 ABC transporter substrate-binding protein [Pseudoroseomonas wenyumeiae]RMI17047.1 ABC transporter substrate-binding protein [Pseudoroseomonas wenyumeiae]